MKKIFLLFAIVVFFYSVNADRCLSFDGINDVVNCKNVKEINNATQLTVEMWVRIDAFSAWKTFFVKRLDQFNRVQFQEYNSPGRLGVVVSNNNGITSNKYDGYYYTVDKVVAIGDWFHLAMVYNGILESDKRLKIYINGSVRTLAKHDVMTGDVPERLPSTDAPILLGAETVTGKYGYTGLMDEIRIWQTARTESEIRATMDSVLVGDEPGLLMYYRFEAAGNEVTAKPNDILKDFSKNGYDGTLFNFALKGQTSNWVMRLVAEPSVQSSNIETLSKKANSFSLRWTRGSGVSNSVFVTKSSMGIAEPHDQTAYIGDSVFKNGTKLESGEWFCVYSGNADNVNVSALEPGTTYRVMVCDFNGSSGAENYRTDTTTGNPVNIITKKEQTLSFPPVTTVTNEGSTVEFPVRASSELPVALTSSNNAIATYDNGKLHCITPGNVVLTAVQKGDSIYDTVTAEYTIQVVSREKKNQTITFSLGTDSLKVVGDEPIATSPSASSKLPVRLISSDTAVAVIRDNNKIEIKAAGTTIVIAYQDGNELFNPSQPVEAILKVKNAYAGNAPHKVINDRKWKRLPFLAVAGGGVGIGLVTAIILSMHNDNNGDGSTQTTATLPTGPPSDP